MFKIKSVMIACFAALSLMAGPDMSLVCGDYRIVFDIGTQAKCSIVQVFYKDVEVGTRSGWYGTVFCPASGKYIGAGHTEGGSERVQKTELWVDGKETPVQGGTVTGNEFRLHKSTQLDKLALDVVWKLTPAGLDIEKKFTATDAQPFHLLYIFQKCWSRQSTDWLLFKMDGTTEGGAFPPPQSKPTGDKVTWPLRGETNGFCITQYFDKEKVAHLSYIADFSNVSGANYLWNVKGYHKQYFSLLLHKTLPAGFKSPLYRMSIRCFGAESQEEWKAKATALKDELLAQYPLFPTRLEPLRGSTIVMPPSPDKQQIQKVLLKLQPDTLYDISFQISKTEGMSKSPTHHYAFVGYYDKENKKYPQLVQLAVKVPHDGQFHSVKGAFRTPKTAETLYLYLYNSRSKGTVEVKDILLEKRTE